MTYHRTEKLPVVQGDIYWLAEPQKGLLEGLYQMEPDPDPIRVFEGTAFAPQASQSPILFSASPQGGLLEFLAANPQQFDGLLVTTDASKDELLGHLQCLLEGRFQQHRKALLRYYDPRVASYLLPSCTTDMLPRWLGPVNAFSWFGGTWADEVEGNLNWHSLSWSDSPRSRQQHTSLTLTEEQVHRMVDQGLERFAWDWLRNKPGKKMGQVMEWITAGIAAGHDEHGSLTAWLNSQAPTMGEHYA